MEITIKLTGLDALASSISELASALQAGVKADEVIARAKKPAKPAATQSAAEEAQPQAVAPAPATVSRSKVTAADVRAKLTPLVKAGKGEQVQAMLLTFGAASVSSLKEDQFEAVIAAADKL